MLGQGYTVAVTIVTSILTWLTTDVVIRPAFVKHHDAEIKMITQEQKENLIAMIEENQDVMLHQDVRDKVVMDSQSLKRFTEDHISIAFTGFKNELDFDERIKFFHKRLDNVEAAVNKMEQNYAKLSQMFEELKSDTESRFQTTSDSIKNVQENSKTDIKTVVKSLELHRIEVDSRVMRLGDEVKYLKDRTEQEKTDNEMFKMEIKEQVERFKGEMSLRELKAEKSRNTFKKDQTSFQDKVDQQLMDLKEDQTNWYTNVKTVLHECGIHVEGDHTVFDMKTLALLPSVFHFLVEIILIYLNIRTNKRVTSYKGSVNNVIEWVKGSLYQEYEESSKGNSESDGNTTFSDERPGKDNVEKPAEKVIYSAISFQGGSAQRSHTQMAETIIQRKELKKLMPRPEKPSSPVSLSHILVTSETDIPLLRPSKLTFVFIDHSDGDKILDGYFREKTIEHAMEISDAVVVVYCWDTKSKDLELGQLFSPRLEDSISENVLLTLRKRQSFYSIYKQFTYFQQRHMINKISGLLEEKAALAIEGKEPLKSLPAPVGSPTESKKDNVPKG